MFACGRHRSELCQITSSVPSPATHLCVSECVRVCACVCAGGWMGGTEQRGLIRDRMIVCDLATEL